MQKIDRIPAKGQKMPESKMPKMPMMPMMTPAGMKKMANKAVTIMRIITGCLILGFFLSMVVSCDSPLGVTPTEATQSHDYVIQATKELQAALAMADGPDKIMAVEKAQARFEDALNKSVILEKRVETAEANAEKLSAGNTFIGGLTSPSGIGLIVTTLTGILIEYKRRQQKSISAGLTEDVEYAKAHIPPVIVSTVMDNIRAKQEARNQTDAIGSLVEMIPDSVTEAAVKSAGVLLTGAMEGKNLQQITADAKTEGLNLVKGITESNLQTP